MLNFVIILCSLYMLKYMYLLHTISSLALGVILVTFVFEFAYISCNNKTVWRTVRSTCNINKNIRRWTNDFVWTRWNWKKRKRNFSTNILQIFDYAYMVCKKKRIRIIAHCTSRYITNEKSLENLILFLTFPGFIIYQLLKLHFGNSNILKF